MDSSSSSSFVSRAKTALHTAAAKAEKVFTDIKAIDLKTTDKEIEGGLKISTRSIDQEKIETPILKVNESEQKISGSEINLSKKINFPSASLVKQLAIAIEAGKSYRSMSDLKSNGFKEKSSLSFSVVKSLVLREKEEKLNNDIFGEEEIQNLISSLFRPRNLSPNYKNIMYLIHGAPPESFVHKLSEIFGAINSLHKMALFWDSIILQIRNLWSNGEPIPNIPKDEPPDLKCCLLFQHLQVVNSCIARKKRKKIARESFENIIKNQNNFQENQEFDSKIYAKSVNGDFVLRLGANCVYENLKMLETGEPVYSPVMQEGPILTEDLIRETEELVLRTGSLGAGCSQLLSDMQAFKAANPGCVLEDFIRWHSPPDWNEYNNNIINNNNNNNSENKEGSSRRGRLSDRMQTKGNLWHELWETAKPLPAVEQTPLFDEDLAVEGIIDFFEEIEPSRLFEQLLATILSVGFLAAEKTINLENEKLSKLYNECRDYIVSILKRDLSKENLGDLCQVYETIEAIAINPQEALTIVESEGKTEEIKSGFRKINLNFITKDRGPLWKRAAKEEKNEKNEKQQSHVFSHLLEKKASLFSKRPSKSEKLEIGPHDKNSLEDDWTIL
ncbi:hypothetical protein LUZ60_010781 [Juncus effusus]|nr:hypothetical protein LUZ60_010781 [Juncus effusus]